MPARLYRFSCPTPGQLIAYRQGKLQGDEYLTVAQHVRQCPHCAREIATLAHDEECSGGRLSVAVEVLEATH